MPIRRPRGPKPVLRHVAFLEAMASQPETAPAREALQAGFLTLRLLDEWISLGGMIAEADSQVHTATRTAVEMMTDDVEARTALGRIIEAITMLHDPDAQPVLPRVFAYGSLLEHRGQFALAADVYGAVSKYVDVRGHFDLAFDAFMKQGFCYRLVAELDHAERAYESAAMLAGRTRDRSRVLYARIGEAKVLWSRGNLPAADEALTKIAAEAEGLGDARLHAIALHDCASVARLREDLPRAVRLAYESFKRTTDEGDRERVLADLGNFLGLTGAFDAARAALTVLERGARTQETRWFARANLMDLATREGSETSFEQHRRALEQTPLPARLGAGYHRDAAKGLARFGRLSEARQALDRARELATKHGMHQMSFEVDALAAALEEQAKKARRIAPVPAPADIAATLEELMRETATV
jgi:tetratricopeptide (TPR) repeat protein